MEAITLKRFALAVALGSIMLGPLACSEVPDYPGKEVFMEACERCHPLGRVINKCKTRQEWERTVRVMRKQGARIDDAEAATIVDYLTATCSVEQGK